MKKLGKEEVFGVLTAIPLMIGAIYMQDYMSDGIALFCMKIAIVCFGISIFAYSMVIIIKLRNK